MVTNSGLAGAATTFILVACFNLAAGQLQCYECGNELIPLDNGSFVVGNSNRGSSCRFMRDEMRRLNRSAPPDAFVRSCPVGTKNCFGICDDTEEGFPENDLDGFGSMGCSGSDFVGDGCSMDEVLGNGEKTGRLCKCSKNLCNNPYDGICQRYAGQVAWDCT